MSSTHLLRNFKAIVAEVSHHDVLRTSKLSDCRSHCTDKTSTCNQYVFAEEGERKCSVSSITEGVHDSRHIVRDTIVELYYVAFGDAEIFRKRTITVYTYADAVFTNVLQTTAAVTAMTTSDVTFTRYAVAHLNITHSGTYFGNNAYVFVTNGHGSLNCLLAPFVPLVDVQVSTANSSLLNLNENVVHAYFGHGNFFQPDTLLGFFLD